MKKWLVLLLSLLVLLAVSACSKKGPPTLKVTVQQQGTSMVILADTGSSFKLGVDGHMHVQINDGPVTMPAGNRYTLPNWAPGTYKVYVELADKGHNPLGISDTVEFAMK
jgi:predicted small lipoprotein YifL